MNSTFTAPLLDTQPRLSRHWLAELHLELGERAGRTALLRSRHLGPLRVQRPFYPEADGTAHLYLLHPPGGLVLGDELNVHTHLRANAQALITTPSAGKVYATAQSAERQIQKVNLLLGEGAQLEWLPQETIVFDGANCQLHTRIEMAPTAFICAWDIVVLGRPAAGEVFSSGRCEQKLELWREGRLVFSERNLFEGGSAGLCAPWGLAGCHTSGTFLASAQIDRAGVDALLEDLSAFDSVHHWGLTQKQDLLIARYLGESAPVCRQGFCLIWERIRTNVVQKPVSPPRVWAT